MSKNNQEKDNNKDDKPQPHSPNPFTQFLPTTPLNLSPRSDNNSSSPRTPKFHHEFNSSLRTQIDSPTSISNAMLTSASPPRFATIDQFMTAANAVQNMALAHEISVNQNFKLEKLEYDSNSFEKQIHDTVHKAFWNSLKEDFEKNPIDYKHAFVIITEAKQALLSLLLPNHIKFREQIENILDLELIKQQMDKNTFDYEHYSNFLIQIMSKLCAPARDNIIENLKNLKDPVEMFKGIMETLELLKLDMANFTIQQMRPYIQQQVVIYEQKKFKELLEAQKENGIDGLEFTRQWLDRAKKRIIESNSIGLFRHDTGPTPSAIVNEAFMEIFIWKSSLIFPETLSMDEMRFNEIYLKCRKFLLVCAVMNTIFTFLGESIAALEELKNKLKEDILILVDEFINKTFEELMKHIADQIIKITNEYMAKNDKKRLNESQEIGLRALIVDIASKDILENSVYKLLFSRYINFLQNILTKRTQGPVKLPQGMSIMEKELMENTGKFLRLVTFNKTVFGSYYGEIIEILDKL